MGLLDEQTWQGRVFTGGWVPAEGGDAAVVEPATGAELGRVGIGDAADISRAARVAAGAQRDWAALPYTERAAVLRRAGDLFTTHAEEITGWLVREVGSIPGKAQFEIGTAAQECYEAAT
ncbi:MAG: aldehyde dehydrogenase family protein, partial [Catenulispora sp.]